MYIKRNLKKKLFFSQKRKYKITIKQDIEILSLPRNSRLTFCRFLFSLLFTQNLGKLHTARSLSFSLSLGSVLEKFAHHSYTALCVCILHTTLDQV